MKAIDIHPADCWNGNGFDYYLTGSTVTYASGGEADQERICIGNEGKKCLLDGEALSCLNDYIGGGSHYWHLVCVACGCEYYYDTYRFTLEAKPC